MIFKTFRRWIHSNTGHRQHAQLEEELFLEKTLRPLGKVTELEPTVGTSGTYYGGDKVLINLRGPFHYAIVAHETASEY